MKNARKSMTFFSIACMLMQTMLYAQTPETPTAYLSYINSVQSPIQQDFMTYASTVARGKSARKVESKRKELIQSVAEAQNKIKALAPYKGDKGYRDSTVKLLNMTYKILNEDYSKIVDMEEVAEQSYDAMEAYYLVQDKASDKLQMASNMKDSAFYIFARKYNVSINEGETDELSRNIKKASEAMSYQRKVYLIFFKPYKQEAYLWDAINKKNISGIEQHKNSLLFLSEEALKKLDTTKAFKNDRNLVVIAKEVQNFYKEECKTKIVLATDYIIKEENFTKAKKAFDAKNPNTRTQADIDTFNSMVNEYNKAVNSFNAASTTLNNQRFALLEKWNKASQSFLDTHVPKYKK